MVVAGVAGHSSTCEQTSPAGIPDVQIVQAGGVFDPRSGALRGCIGSAHTSMISQVRCYAVPGIFTTLCLHRILLLKNSHEKQ